MVGGVWIRYIGIRDRAWGKNSTVIQGGYMMSKHEGKTLA